MVMTPQSMDTYFARLDKELKDCYKIAQQCRKAGLDPKPTVEIPLAQNMAERVEVLYLP